MAINFVSFIIETALSLYLTIMIIKLLLRWHDSNYNNPITQQFAQISDYLAQPFNDRIPTLNRFEFGTLTAATFVAAVNIIILGFIEGVSTPLFSIIIWALIGLAYMISNIYFVAIIAVVILSWVAPTHRHPLAQIANELTEPLFSFFRKLIPAMGGLDISPIFVIIGISFTQRVIQYLAFKTSLPALIVIGV